MATLNKVLLMGRLTKDLELRKLPSGTSVVDMRLAVDDSYRDKEGKDVERTVFVDVSVWARQAELCAQYLKKGSPVLVEGKLELSEWTTEQGEKRSRLRVRAMVVQFLSSGQRDRPAGDPAAVDVPPPSDSEPPSFP